MFTCRPGETECISGRTWRVHYGIKHADACQLHVKQDLEYVEENPTGNNRKIIQILPNDYITPCHPATCYVMCTDTDGGHSRSKPNVPYQALYTPPPDDLTPDIRLALCPFQTVF